jgi:hypothetical protein
MAERELSEKSAKQFLKLKDSGIKFH